MDTSEERIDVGGVRIAAESIGAQIAAKAQRDADAMMTSWFDSELDRFDEADVKAAARLHAH